MGRGRGREGPWGVKGVGNRGRHASGEVTGQHLALLCVAVDRRAAWAGRGFVSARHGHRFTGAIVGQWNTGPSRTPLHWGHRWTVGHGPVTDTASLGPSLDSGTRARHRHRFTGAIVGQWDTGPSRTPLHWGHRWTVGHGPVTGQWDMGPSWDSGTRVRHWTVGHGPVTDTALLGPSLDSGTRARHWTMGHGRSSCCMVTPAGPTHSLPSRRSTCLSVDFQRRGGGGGGG